VPFRNSGSDCTLTEQWETEGDIIMALAAVEDLELRSVDITSAFTNGDLDEEIYMKQPEGFVEGTLMGNRSG